MIKAAFFDVDGTLVSFRKKLISDALLADLAELRRKGVKLFLATGRAKPDLEQTGMLRTAEFDACVTLNGQYCYNEQGLYRDVPICMEDLRNACRVLNENPSFAARMEAGEKTCINRFNDLVRSMLEFAHIDRYEIQPPEWMLSRKIYQFVPMVDENEQEKFLSVMPHCVYTRWHPQGIDILPRGNGKADGIQTTLDHYGLEREEVIAFGDGDNDLSMLKLAGTAVAMGNAVEHVKAAADYVTDTVENDGICQALRHFGLL